MTREVGFGVPGRLQPKQRPRLGKGNVFTPRETKDYEELVAWHAKIALANREPLEGRLGLEVWVHGLRANIDGDNCLKVISDACNGLIYRDDRQIDEWLCHIERKNENPHVVVRVWELEE